MSLSPALLGYNFSTFPRYLWSEYWPVINGRCHDAESDEIRQGEVEHQGGDVLDRGPAIAGKAARVEQQRHDENTEENLPAII